jgi:hypothetical protein
MPEAVDLRGTGDKGPSETIVEQCHHNFSKLQLAEQALINEVVDSIIV